MGRKFFVINSKASNFHRRKMSSLVRGELNQKEESSKSFWITLVKSREESTSSSRNLNMPSKEFLKNPSMKPIVIGKISAFSFWRSPGLLGEDSKDNNLLRD